MVLIRWINVDTNDYGCVDITIWKDLAYKICPKDIYRVRIFHSFPDKHVDYEQVIPEHGKHVYIKISTKEELRTKHMEMKRLVCYGEHQEVYYHVQKSCKFTFLNQKIVYRFDELPRDRTPCRYCGFLYEKKIV